MSCYQSTVKYIAWIIGDETLTSEQMNYNIGQNQIHQLWNALIPHSLRGLGRQDTGKICRWILLRKLVRYIYTTRHEATWPFPMLECQMCEVWGLIDTVRLQAKWSRKAGGFSWWGWTMRNLKSLERVVHLKHIIIGAQMAKGKYKFHIIRKWLWSLYNLNYI